MKLTQAFIADIKDLITSAPIFQAETGKAQTRSAQFKLSRTMPGQVDARRPGFQPSGGCGLGTQGVALGWSGAGALPLWRGRKKEGSQSVTKCHRLKLPAALRTLRTRREATRVRSANGAGLYQPGETPQGRGRKNEGRQLVTKCNRLKLPAALATLRTREDGPGFQPLGWCGLGTQGVALGWYGAGALPLGRGRK
jgi:hypothetical protein